MLHVVHVWLKHNATPAWFAMCTNDAHVCSNCVCHTVCQQVSRLFVTEQSKWVEATGVSLCIAPSPGADIGGCMQQLGRGEHFMAHLGAEQVLLHTEYVSTSDGQVLMMVYSSQYTILAIYDTLRNMASAPAP